jgi:hypothetical protein
MRKLVIAGLLSAIFIAANANVFAGINEKDKDKKPTATESVKAEKRSVIDRAESAPSFDPYSAANLKADYNQNKKSGKKFSTTTKVLIGVGIAAAVLAIVFVAARNDLEDDILR